jgi:dTDP-6-deoxy-L-talose 4-dehydrogenase (NAD+)
LGRPDVLIHLAWSGLPNYTSAHHFEPHLGQQYRFLSRLVESGLRSVLCTGTCFEYGLSSGELSEDATPDPQNPYGFAKDALRRQLYFLRERVSFDLTWARLFYMYGEGQSPSSIYMQLKKAVKDGEPAFRMSGGEQLRDYLPIEEVAAALVSLALDAPNAGIVNVCSGRPISVRSLVERWIKVNGWSIELELGYYPYPKHEPMAFWGRNARLAALLSGLRK